MAKFKTPKLKHLPSKPRTNANLAAWEKYEAKVYATQLDNKKKMTQYYKDIKAQEQMIEKKKSIIAKMRYAKPIKETVHAGTKFRIPR